MSDEHKVLLRLARERMAEELRRYDTKDIHVTLEEPPFEYRDATFRGLELRMYRIGPGLGDEAPFDFAVWRIPEHLIRAGKVYRAMEDGIATMCAKLFGVHEGSGLP